MSSSRSIFLPVGYFLRSANDRDSANIIFFKLIWHNSLFGKGIIILFILLIILFLAKGRMYISFMLMFPVLIICITSFANHLKQMNGISNKLFSAWLVERDNTVRGYTICNNLNTCTILSDILVCNADRRKGIGSFLISHCVETCRKPIYLLSDSQLKIFYYNSGFVDAEYLDIPTKISKWRQYKDMQIMVFHERNE